MWRERAAEIPDPTLRAQALEALAKRGNMEGAAAFATFVPREQRATVVRAMVAFQTAYNHLDTISEQRGEIGPAEARVLHEALLAALAALRPGAWSGRGVSMESGHDDERPIHPPKNNEDGYLQALVETCQEALSELPSYEVVAPAARRAAERVVSSRPSTGTSAGRSSGGGAHRRRRVAPSAGGRRPPRGAPRWVCT